jgi:glyoxylase-like metal-dependent hydrolase (beta-lactamase superfamily II)
MQGMTDTAAVGNDRFYFRQLLAGLDIATDDMMAMQMANFVYLVGDKATGEAVAIDLAYDIDGTLDLLEADGMRLTGVLATHYHPDHVGGSLAGHRIAGITDVVERVDVPIHVQADEAEWVVKATEIDHGALVTHDSGDVVQVGDIPITLVHTPGHTPGSQCFLVNGRLVSGDTLFLDGCGRTDLPGGDPEQMWFSITERLGKVPDDTILFPGHLYSEKPSASMGETRGRNVVYRPDTKEQWLMMFGNG